MITLAKTLAFFGLLVLIATVMPQVDHLPYGMDEALTLFVSTIHGIISLMPWMQTPWNLILVAIGVDIALFTWHWIRYFVDLVKG